MPVAVGVDLGSTHCNVGVWHQGRPEVIANHHGLRATPTMVAFTDSEVLVGEAALSQMPKNVANTVTGFKWMVGRRHEHLEPHVKMMLGEPRDETQRLDEYTHGVCPPLYELPQWATQCENLLCRIGPSPSTLGIPRFTTILFHEYPHTRMGLFLAATTSYALLFVLTKVDGLLERPSSYFGPT